MARKARIVIPGVPHHVTQRGNRRQQTFFCDNDYWSYLQIMAMHCKSANVEIWAYALMPNHIHMIAVPPTPKALTKAVAHAHEQYTRMINARYGWQGHLWQGRYFSAPMDDQHTVTCARYIEQNPVRGGISATAVAYPWSSCRAHVFGGADVLVAGNPLSKWVRNWGEFVGVDLDAANEEVRTIRKNTTAGRKIGDV